MYVRVSTCEGLTDIDALASRLRALVIPRVKGRTGFRGIAASADRATGGLAVLTAWDTALDLEAGEELALETQSEVLEGTGAASGPFQVYEQVVQEIGDKPPAPGCCLVVTPITVKPTGIDEKIDYFRATVLPELRSSGGFREVRNLIDRQTGQGRVGTVWDDEVAREAWMTRARRLRAHGTGSIQFGAPSYREVVVYERH
jgi:heme-degrading monooxygenase HmoA